MKQITLQSVKKTQDISYNENKNKDSVEGKEARKEGDKAVRIVFLATDENDVDLEVRTSLTVSQAKELKAALGIEYIEHEDEYDMPKPFLIEIDETEIIETRFDGRKYQKPMWEHKTGKFKGYNFDYYQVHKKAFLDAGVITKAKIVVERSSIF
jgi:hypothetical protein